MRDILSFMLSELVQEESDPALARLQDKYCDVSYEEAKREEAELMRAMASAMFGVVLGKVARPKSCPWTARCWW